MQNRADDPASALPAMRITAATELAGLSPAYFGMVMATGILSLGAHRLDLPAVAAALFDLNIVVYAALWCLFALRMVMFPRRFFGDMVDHLRAPGYFTTVAGTCVLGSQFVVIADHQRAGMALWIAAIVLWAALTYTVFAAFTVKTRKPTLDQGISSAWLLAVVSTQSIAVLGAFLAPHIAQPGRLAMNFAALSLWLCAGMLYIWVMGLIFYRYTFFPLTPAELSPPYWINMGAMAISTLAGSLLIVNAPDAPFLHSLLPFLKGFTVFYWATGTWWIPMLVILALWRHVCKRYPLRYDPLYWGAVFPLGMYAVGTQEMTVALEFPFLQAVPPLFLYVGLAAWTAAFVGLLRDVLRRLGAFRSNTITS